MTLPVSRLTVSLDHSAPGPQPGRANRGDPSRRGPGRILFLQPASAHCSGKYSLATALEDRGYQTAVAAELPPGGPGGFDLVIAHRPHAHPVLMEGLAACSKARIPLILDLDVDFKHMPHDHPEYEGFGLQIPPRIQAYEAALQLAQMIRVPGEAFAAALRSTGRRVQVIPESWNRDNELWSKPAAARYTLNLGWLGSPGGCEDLRELRRVLTRVLREFPHVRMVIGGDPQAGRLFERLPEGRCLCLPAPNAEDYPYLLSQIDLLVVPLRSTLFHWHSCDRRLMEAGVRGIPWVASPIPAYDGWGAGGLVTHSLEEWHAVLRQLILDADLRAALGQAGRQRAEGREMEHIVKAWLELIEGMLAGKAPAGQKWTVL